MKLPTPHARAELKSFVCEVYRNVSSKSTVISDSLINFSSFPKPNESDANLNVVLNDLHYKIELVGERISAIESSIFNHNAIIRDLQGEFSSFTNKFNTLTSKQSDIGVIYGLPKVHKPGNPVRPICSAVGSYNLGRFAAKIIQPAAKNSFGRDLENTFQFVNQVRHCELKDLYMVSFDVRSLFTNIPLNKTIKICLDRLYRSNSDIRPNIPEKTLEQMLRLCVTDNTFVIDGKVYTQIDGVAMGNSLGTDPC